MNDLFNGFAIIIILMAVVNAIFIYCDHETIKKLEKGIVGHIFRVAFVMATLCYIAGLLSLVFCGE